MAYCLYKVFTDYASSGRVSLNLVLGEEGAAKGYTRSVGRYRTRDDAHSLNRV